MKFKMLLLSIVGLNLCVFILIILGLVVKLKARNFAYHYIWIMNESSIHNNAYKYTLYFIIIQH